MKEVVLLFEDADGSQATMYLTKKRRPEEVGSTENELPNKVFYGFKMFILTHIFSLTSHLSLLHCQYLSNFQNDQTLIYIICQNYSIPFYQQHEESWCF